MAQANDITGVVGENLRKALDWLPTARELVTVKCDADLSDAVPSFESALRPQPVSAEGLAALRDQFDLGKSLRGLLNDTAEAGSGVGSRPAPVGTGHWGGEQDLPVPVSAVGPVSYKTILTAEDLAELVTALAAAPLVAFDTETTGLDPRQADLVGLSFSWAVGQAVYVPVGHRYAGVPDQLPLAEVLAALKAWFESAQHPKLGQNLKYDAHVLRRHGIRVAGIAHDTLLASYVLEAHRSHDLASLAERHLGRKGLSYDEVTGKGASRIGFEEVAIDVATQYSGEDADFTFHLHEVLWPQISADPHLLRVYSEIEMPALTVLLEMESAGIAVATELLDQQSQELAVSIARLETQAHELAGGPFNLGSPKQLAEILFERLGYSPVKKTAKGAPSTDEDVLAQLAQDYPLPKCLLEWRGLSKLKSTYTDKLPRMVDPQTGRVHTTFSQAVAVTGRLASSEPNLQNIPIRTPEGRRIRQAFVAPPGHLLVSADYSQIELRIMAHLSEDPGLVSAFEQGEDVHRATASEIFGTPREEITDEQRRYAKVINFGLIYGMSAFGLAQNLDIERSAAKVYMDRYFARYPGVARYMEDIKQQARAQGYVETVFGRRLWLPEIASPNGPRRAGAERAAINAPMQGTAADLIKLAMIQMDKALAAAGLRSRMLLQVHDELIFEVPEQEWTAISELVPSVMESVASLRVPLVVSVGSGPNWDAAH
jgi:DNA polymerase I